MLFVQSVIRIILTRMIEYIILLGEYVTDEIEIIFIHNLNS